MGRILLICRLAARDLRRRPAEAALLLLAIIAATTTLTLGLVLHGVTDEPYESTRDGHSRARRRGQCERGPVPRSARRPRRARGADRRSRRHRQQRPIPAHRGGTRGERRHRSRPARGGPRWSGGVGTRPRPRGGRGRPARADPRRLGTRRRSGRRGRLRRRARTRRRGRDHLADPNVWAHDSRRAAGLSCGEPPLVRGCGRGGHRRREAISGCVLRPRLPRDRRGH